MRSVETTSRNSCFIRAAQDDERVAVEVNERVVFNLTLRLRNRRLPVAAALCVVKRFLNHRLHRVLV